jgi:PAS domain S-box-containing protein
MAQQEIVLVADSRCSDRLARLLRARGHEVRTGSNAAGTLAHINAHPPALIVLAAQVADMSGFEICRRLKHRQRTRNIPLLFIANNAVEEEEALRAGASDFIPSTLRAPEVLARVEAHLELARHRAGAQSKNSTPSTVESDGWMHLALGAGRMYAFAWDVQTDVVRTSVGAEFLVGGDSTLRETGEDFFQRIHPQDVAQYRQILAVLSPAYDMYQTHHRLVRSDGDVITVRESGRGFFDDEGRLTRVIGIRADISEQEAARRDLETGRTHLLHLIERLPIGVALANEQGRIEYINDRFTANFGYRQEEIAAPEAWWRQAYPDESYRREVIEMWGGLVESAARRGENIPPREYQITGKDGAVHYTIISGAVLGNWKLLLFDDITERRRADAALRESEGRFRLMADSAPVMLWVSGPDKLCTFFNKGWLTFTGRSMEEELGNGWAERVHRDDLGRCMAIYSAAFDAREMFQMEYRLRRADGEYRWILDNGAPRFEADGAFAGYMGSCVDVTDFKRTQEQMLAAQKLESLGVLAGGVAHDFHNYLGCILADAVVTMSELEVNSPARDSLERIEAVAVQAAQIVRQIMDYTGQPPEDAGPVDVAQLVREMADILQACIPKQAKLVLNLPESLPISRANSTQLRQVIMNLALNAGEAIGGQGGTIAIAGGAGGGEDRTIESKEAYVYLEVSDTGAGMTAAVRGRIFDASFSTKGAGRGMGLAAVREIVRVHGGTIQVTSTPGAGTCFRVLFPSEGKLAGQPSAEPAAQRLSPRRGAILIVEDEETLRMSVATMLRKQGFAVLEAADGDRAFDLIRDGDEDIAVVLLDLTLPGKSSPEVFAELQRSRPDAKVILTSAYGRESVAGPLKGLDRQNFIRKPYQFSDLVTVVQQALPGGRAPAAKAH